MRYSPRSLVARLLLAGLVSLTRPVAAQSACLPADSITVVRLRWLDSLATRMDSEYVANRQLLNIPQTTSPNVKLITTNGTCGSARTAVNAVVGTPGRVTRVHLYKLGNRYAVEDPGLLGIKGDYRPVHFFSSGFVYLSFAQLTK